MLSTSKQTVIAEHNFDRTKYTISEKKFLAVISQWVTHKLLLETTFTLEMDLKSLEWLESQKQSHP